VHGEPELVASGLLFLAGGSRADTIRMGSAKADAHEVVVAGYEDAILMVVTPGW